jgi:hypothetical protein
MRRRLRLWRAAEEARWPAVPAGVFLNPSDADFAAYERAALALTWCQAAAGDTPGWQTKAREKLRHLLGLAAAESSPAGPVVDGEAAAVGDGLRRRTVYLPRGVRRHVPVTLVWDPARAAEARPVMLCLQGHNSGAHLSWGEARLPVDLRRVDQGGDFALQAVRHGHVAVCIEQIAFGERREQALAHRWDHSCVDASNRALLLGRTLLGDRVQDVMAVIDWLTGKPAALPAFDPGRIRAMGNSAGGETALIAAALDPRIGGLIASGCVGAWRKTSGRRKTCPDTVIPGVLGWFEYSDVLALCAPRVLLVVSGIDDHIYPFALAAACVEEARPAYAALGAAARLRAVSGPGGHRFYPAAAWPAFNDLMDSAV